MIARLTSQLGRAIELWLALCAAPCDGVNWQPTVHELRLEKHDRECRFRKFYEVER